MLVLVLGTEALTSEGNSFKGIQSGVQEFSVNGLDCIVMGSYEYLRDKFHWWINQLSNVEEIYVDSDFAGYNDKTIVIASEESLEATMELLTGDDTVTPETV